MVKAYCKSALTTSLQQETHGLDVDIGPGDLVDETTLSDIWVTTDKECSGVGVDSR